MRRWGDLRRRVVELEPEVVRPSPWPPTSGLGKILFNQLGLPPDEPRPGGYPLLELIKRSVPLSWGSEGPEEGEGDEGQRAP